MTRHLLTSVSALALLLAAPIEFAAANAASTEIKIAQAKGAGASDNTGQAKKDKLKELCEDGTKPPCADAAPEPAESVPVNTEATGAEAVPTLAEPPTAIAPAGAEPVPSAIVTEEQSPTAAQTEIQAATEESAAAAGAAVTEEQQAPVEAIVSDEAPGQKKKKSEAVQAVPEVTAPETADTATAAGQPPADSNLSAEAQAAPAAVEATPPADPATTEEAPTASEEPTPKPIVAETPSDEAKPVDAATPTDTATGEATSTGAPVEDKPAATVETAEQPETKQTADGSKKKRRKQSQEAPAAAATNDQAEPVETTTETVTKETTRTSSEEVVEANVQRRDKKDDSNDLIKILGAAAGGVVVGALLNEAFNDGGTVVENTGDRVIIERDGEYYVRKDENEILRRPGSEVRTETFRDGSSRTIVDRADGSSVVTIRDTDGYVVQRVRILPDGQRIVLFDDTGDVRDSRNSVDTRRNFWIEEDQLPRFDPTALPQRRYVDYRNTDRGGLRDALMARPVATIDRSYTLRQVRENWRLRDAMPRLDLDAISFDLGSAAIAPDQVRMLDTLGWAMEDILKQNPDEVFLIEGHTDAVGSRISNLVLSDRRAETVALALTEYYDIPPENLITRLRRGISQDRDPGRGTRQPEGDGATHHATVGNNGAGTVTAARANRTFRMSSRSGPRSISPDLSATPALKGALVKSYCSAHNPAVTIAIGEAPKFHPTSRFDEHSCVPKSIMNVAIGAIA